MTRDLNETLMFVKVVERGSFTAAALALGVPKTTLSRKIQDLEDRLATKLLKRTTRKLGLTESGQVYFEHCARIARELDEAETAVNQLSTAPRGWLRFTAPYSLGVNSLARLLPEFMERYPDVRIEMQLDNSVIDLVSNSIDVALRVGSLPDSSLSAHRLGQFQSHVYASPSYLARHGEPLSPVELEHHRAIALTKDRHNGRFSWGLAQAGEEFEDYAINPVLVVNDPVSMRTAALQGLGIVRMVDVMAAPFEASGCLRRVLSVWALPQVDLNAVFPQGRAVSPKVRAFVDFLVERFQLDISMEEFGGCPETREAIHAARLKGVPVTHALEEVIARVASNETAQPAAVEAEKLAAP